MIGPAITPWMEKPDNLPSARVNGCRSVPFCRSHKTQAYAKLSALDRPPCLRLTMWSTWCGKPASSSRMRQYSQRQSVRRATSARSSWLMSLATSEDLAGSGFCHSQDVLQLHEVDEFCLLIGRKAFILLEVDQLGDSLLGLWRRPKMSDRFRRGTGGDKVDNLEVSGAGHGSLAFNHISPHGWHSSWRATKYILPLTHPTPSKNPTASRYSRSLPAGRCC